MEYVGKSERHRVRIIASAGPWARYYGQECEAILYEGDVNPQLNTEQLNPPLPKWQSIKSAEVAVLPSR